MSDVRLFFIKYKGKYAVEAVDIEGLPRIYWTKTNGGASHWMRPGLAHRVFEDYKRRVGAHREKDLELVFEYRERRG